MWNYHLQASHKHLNLQQVQVLDETNPIMALSLNFKLYHAFFHRRSHHTTLPPSNHRYGWNLALEWRNTKSVQAALQK
jgi:hypothetical protein